MKRSTSKTVGFANSKLILRLRDNVLNFLKVTYDPLATWEFQEPVMHEKQGGVWESIFASKGIRHSVVFKEDASGGITVYVDNKNLAYVGRDGSFDAPFLRCFWQALKVKV